MKSSLALVPKESNRTAVAKNRSLPYSIKKRILKDARQASKGYILAFTVPAGGE